MKIAFICDTHVPNGENSPQYAFLLRAIERIKEDNIDKVIHLGDVTAFGEKEGFEQYLRLTSGLKGSSYLLGNSDVRDERTKDYILSMAKPLEFIEGGKTFLGINTPFRTLTEQESEKILALKDGDVLMMHHSPLSLLEEDKKFFDIVLESKKLTVIHAHTHKKSDTIYKNSRIISLRALDPDKSVGDYSCINYLDLSQAEISPQEVVFSEKVEVLIDIKNHFGISCVDNVNDLTYALENGIKAVELRCNSAGWEPDYTLIPLIEKWRKKTNGYLSIHMPNLKFDGENIIGEQEWQKAVEYAVKINANGLTMHPPKIKKPELSKQLFDKFVSLYVYAVQNVNSTVNIGIENIHKSKNESDKDFSLLGFGYTPDDVNELIDAINERVGKERVGSVLDVGHARNNGKLSSIYPISRWYELMGKKIVAYHVHQVYKIADGLKNHNAIEGWFGPLISYASFFYCWRKEIINKCPIFLEVKGAENYQKSIVAFEKLIEKKT